MATQILALGYGIAAHPNLKLDIFPLGVDAAIETALPLNAGAVNRQWYEATRIGTESGWHVCVLKDSGEETADGPFYVKLANADGTYYLTDILPDEVAGFAMTLTPAERNSIADAYLDRIDGVETGVTPRRYMQITGAVIAGVITTAGTGEEEFLGLDGVTSRVIVTVDTDGNRSSVVYG